MKGNQDKQVKEKGLCRSHIAEDSEEWKTSKGLGNGGATEGTDKGVSNMGIKGGRVRLVSHNKPRNKKREPCMIWD